VRGNAGDSRPAATTRAEAETLAAAMSALPQACLAWNKLSAYEQFDPPLAIAQVGKFIHEMNALAFGKGPRRAVHFAAGRCARIGQPSHAGRAGHKI